MPEFTTILRSFSSDKFGEILNASPRKARETFFHRHSIRGPKSKGLPKPGAKNEARAAALFDVLRDQEDDEMAEEILRAWLLTKRTMLAAALDHLDIPHNNGLTDSDEVSKFEKLSGKDVQTLRKKLDGLAPSDEVAAYLTFMGAKVA